MIEYGNEEYMRVGVRRNWTGKHDIELKRLAKDGMTIVELAEEFDYPPGVIERRLKVLDVAGERKLRRRWTKAEERILRMQYRRLNNRALARTLQRTETSVVGHLSWLGLRRNMRWTPDREQYLRDHHVGMTHEEMAGELKTTVYSVSKRCSLLGLKKS